MGVNKVTLMDLHEMYRHIGFNTLKALPEGQIYHVKPAPRYEACIVRKSVKPTAKRQKRSENQLTKIRSELLLERLHVDLIGPFYKKIVRQELCSYHDR